MNLLDDAALDRSPTVANSSMNRERGLVGRNSYALDLALDPLQFLVDRLQGGSSTTRVAWLDLCCGTGRALIEAGLRLRDRGLDSRVEIRGIDLVPMFWDAPEVPACVCLEAASLHRWEPGRSFDLITCVHGLHYIGDKLDLIRRAVSWLTEDGLFAANLDIANLRLEGFPRPDRILLREMRRQGLAYDTRKKLLSCGGKKEVLFPFRYAGADDQAGPNYTSQPAVNSYYAIEERLG